MGIFDLIVGGTILTILIPIFINYLAEFIEIIGINNDTAIWYQLGLDNIAETIETIITLPEHLIGITGATINNILPNWSFVLTIMIIITIMITFKIMGLIRNGT